MEEDFVGVAREQDDFLQFESGVVLGSSGAEHVVHVEVELVQQFLEGQELEDFGLREKPLVFGLLV